MGDDVNKRQRKKRKAEIIRRAKMLNERVILSGRRNGKYLFLQKMKMAYINKKYKPFKELQKELKIIHISYDLSNGKDYSIKITYKHNKNGVTVMKSEVID